MTPTKEEYLFKVHPIFDRNHERFSTGFNCEDGWFNLLDRIGYWLKFANFANLKIVGVKEKFGHMVIDIEHSNKDESFKINIVLGRIYQDSALICERCGARKKPLEDHCKPMSPFVKIL